MMRYLKFEYISKMIFLWTSIVFSSIVFLSPLAIIITACIILNDCFFLILLPIVPFFISTGIMIVEVIIDEMRDAKSEYDTRKRLYEMIGMK